MKAPIRLDVAPAAWAEAVRRSETYRAVGARPSVYSRQKPYTADDAASALAALVRQTPYRIIADGERLIVEIEVHASELPARVAHEWERLRTVAATGICQEDSEQPAEEDAPNQQIHEETARASDDG